MPWICRLLLGCLDSSLGDLATRLLGLGHALDDTDSDGLSHVTDGEAAQWWVVSERLNAHGLGRNHFDDGSITRLNELRVVFDRLAAAAVNLLEELRELAGNVGGVAIQDWSVTGTDLTRVVYKTLVEIFNIGAQRKLTEDDDLSIEGVAALWRVLLAVTSDVATTNLLDGHVLDVEADIVTWLTLSKLLVMHLDRLDFGGDTSGSEGNDHTGLDHTSFDTSDWYRANTADLVDILERQTEGFVGGAGWLVDGINGLEEGLAGGLGLRLLLPSLVPWAVGGNVNHVVTVEARDWDEGDVLGVVADLLDEVGRLLDDLVVTILGPSE